MDCEHCQRLLLDVAYGECSPQEEKATLAHVASCTSCSADLARLRAGISLAAAIPLQEPSTRTTESILAHARSQALSTRTLAQSPAVAAPSPGSLADRIREFLGQFAMGRQVAMATSMILVVAVGLWFVPHARRQELAVGHVVNPDPNGEAGPSNGIVPAAPLDLDLRQGRIRARSDEPERRRERAVAPTETVAAAEVAPDLDGTEGEGEGTEESAAQNRELRPIGKELETAAPSDGIALADDALPDSNAAEVSPPLAEEPYRITESAVRSRSATVGSGYGIATTAPARKGRSAPASAALEFDESPEAAGFAPPPASAPRPPAPASTSATAEAPRGATEGVSASTEEADSPTPEAQLALARSYRRNGRCDAAVVQYEAFLARAPRHRDAMLEAARCYQQLGRVADATRWTKRADAIASTATSPKSAPAQPATSVQGH